jgi:hypothetical protein
MRKQPKPVESHIFDGMEAAVEEQAQSAAEYSGEELTKRLIEPRPAIDGRTGKMERESPLFFGTIHPTLF